MSTAASLPAVPLAPPPLPLRTAARLRALVERTGHDTRLAILDGDHDATAVADALSRAGARTVLTTGTAPPGDGGPASVIVESALALLAERRRHPSFEPGALACAAGCHRLWYEHSRAASPIAMVDVRRARERRASFLHALEVLLDDVAAGQPLGVVVSMRAGDAETAELLRHLAARPREGARAPLVVVACGAGVSRLTAIRGATWLEVEPLDEEGLRAWLASPEVLSTLLARTGGHVDALERMLRGLPVDAAGVSSHALETLGDVGCRMLEALAVLGRPSDLALVAEVAGVPAADVDVEALARSPLLDVRARGEQHRLAFARQREQDLVLEGLDDAVRRSLEARAGAACRGRDDAAAVRHFLRAGAAGEALEAARDATASLSARHAFEAAVELLDEVRRGLPADAAFSTRALLADLTWSAGDVLAALAHARAVASANPLDSSAHLRVGRLELSRGRIDDATRALDAAAKVEGPAGEHALEIDVERANVLYRAGRADEAAASAEATAARAAQAGRTETMLRARNILAKARIQLGRLDDAEEVLHENLRLARERSLLREEWQASTNLGVVAIAQNRLPRARALLEVSATLASRHGAAAHWAIALENLAVADHVSGRFGDALPRYRECVALLRVLGDREMLSRACYNLADLHLSLGDPYRARSLVAEALAALEGDPNARTRAATRVIAANVEVELGQLARARALLEPVVSREPAGTTAHAEASITLARVDVLDGRPDDAEARLSTITSRGAARIETKLALALTEAALAAGTDAVPRARLALEAAERAHSERRVLSASLLLARALFHAGLSDASARALRRADDIEGRIRRQLEPEMRELFGERAERRAVTEMLVAAERPGVAPGVPKAPTDRALIGRSRPMRRVMTTIERVGPTDAVVLITGESGTGKELVAEALHRASARKDGPFVALNCAAIVETLLLSELFGHERGAFTGATSTRKGRFELAHGGTLFLDEIGEVTPGTQAALLRALQERTFERVGGTRSIHVDVRIIAATNRDLAELVRAGRFREDLYYRLRGIEMELPPLRRRHGDVPLLANELLARIAREGGESKRLSGEAMDALVAQPWPGNVRELENLLRSAVVLTPGPVIEAGDLPGLRRDPDPELDVDHDATPGSGPDLVSQVYDRIRCGETSIYDMRRELERACIERALAESEGNIAKAASFLGMKRPRLSQLVKEHGLKTTKENG